MRKLAEIKDEIEARLSHIDYAYGIKTAEEARQRHETNATLLFDVLDLLAIAAAAVEVRRTRHWLIISPSVAARNSELEIKLGSATRAMNNLCELVAKLEGE